MFALLETEAVAGLQGVPAAPSLAAIAEALSTWLIKIEAVRIVLEEVIAPDDEYDDVRLTADELGSIDVLFATILDTPSGSIQAQPGCIKAARYKPLPRHGELLMATCCPGIAGPALHDFAAPAPATRIEVLACMQCYSVLGRQ